jgi:hypothetical protein
VSPEAEDTHIIHIFEGNCNTYELVDANYKSKTTPLLSSRHQEGEEL